MIGCDGVPPTNFHTLRHTYASPLATAWVPIFVTAKNLGHADMRMTEKHHAHLRPSPDATAIRAANPAALQQRRTASW